jgi:uncharacterized membrane protein
VGAFAVPFDWENVLAGFQSQFFFMLLTSLFVLYFGAAARPFGLFWWLTLLAVITSFFTMASGFLAVFCLLALETWRWLIGERPSKTFLITNEPQPT